MLPDDVRAFYGSCDGFKLTWSYKTEGQTSIMVFPPPSFTLFFNISPPPFNPLTSCTTGIASETSDSLPIGNVTINPLSELVRLCDIKSDTVNMNVMRDLQMLDRLSDKSTPNFTENSKIFELDSSLDVGHVCLVYLDDRAADGAATVATTADRPNNFHLQEEPSTASVWLLDTTYCWHYLAPNFSNYFRKALVHMGLPHWQLKFTDMGLTSIGEVRRALSVICNLT